MSFFKCSRLKKPEYEDVRLVVMNTAVVPRWVAQQEKCDQCKCDFRGVDLSVTALELVDRTVVWLHNDCAAHL